MSFIFIAGQKGALLGKLSHLHNSIALQIVIIFSVLSLGGDKWAELEIHVIPRYTCTT